MFLEVVHRGRPNTSPTHRFRVQGHQLVSGSLRTEGSLLGTGYNLNPLCLSLTGEERFFSFQTLSYLQRMDRLPSPPRKCLDQAPWLQRPPREVLQPPSPIPCAEGFLKGIGPKVVVYTQYRVRPNFSFGFVRSTLERGFTYLSE